MKLDTALTSITLTADLHWLDGRISYSLHRRIEIELGANKSLAQSDNLTFLLCLANLGSQGGYSKALKLTRSFGTTFTIFFQEHFLTS